MNLVAQHDFLGIAGPALQQLKYAAIAPRDDPEMCGPIDWLKMAQLTGLTKLEITDYDYPDIDGPYLLSRGLVELVLVQCPGLDTKLFVPGAFPNLEKLHIEDDSSPEELEAVQEGILPIVPGEDSMGSVIFSLPKLQQISGDCNLFSDEMKEGLLNWDHTLHRAVNAHSSCYNHRNLWTRK